MNPSIRSVYQVPMQRGYSVTDAAKYLGMHPQTLRKRDRNRAEALRETA